MALFPNLVLVLIQAGIFLGLMVALNAIIFKPMLAYLTDREKATEGSRHDAVDLQKKADEKLAEYENRLKAAKADIAAERTTRRQEALQKREVAINAARADLDKRVAEALESISGEKALAARELDRLSRGLAEDITQRVLRGINA